MWFNVKGITTTGGYTPTSGTYPTGHGMLSSTATSNPVYSVLPVVREGSYVSAPRQIMEGSRVFYNPMASWLRPFSIMPFSHPFSLKGGMSGSQYEELLKGFRYPIL